MVFQNNLLAGASGVSSAQADFDPTLIGNSIWLDGSADFLNRQNGSDFSNRKEVTLSFWVQRNKFGDGTINTRQAIFAGLEGGDGFIIHLKGDDTLELHLNGAANLVTNAVFRDIGWYHILVSIDTSQSISSERSKVYINGEQITSFSSAAYPSQNSNIPGISGQMTSSENMRIGNYNNAVANFYFWKGYIAQACMIESKSIQQGDFAVSDFLDTFTFGTNGSQVIPKKDSDIAALASAAGGNSFCLDFSDSSGTDAANLGNDIANNNDFTPTSMAAANQVVHTPSLQFPVLNALNGDATLVGSLGYGNRLAVGVSDWDSVFATKSMGSSGKYYYEVRMHTETGSNGFIAGIHEESTTSKNWANYIGNSTSSVGLGYSLYTDNGSAIRTNGSSSTISGYSSPIASGDIVMMAVDLDNNKLYFGRNGTFFNSGDPANGTGESVAIQADTEYVFGLSTSASEDYFVNFGQDSTFGGETTAGNNTDTNGVGDFKYTVPTGFQCLASSSLTAPDFQGIDYFDVTLYEGNGTNQRVGDFVPFTDTFAIGSSAMWYSEDIRRLSHTYSSEATATSDNSSDSSVYRKATISFWVKFIETNDSDQQIFISQSNSGQSERFIIQAHGTDDNVTIIIDPSGSDNNRTFKFAKGLLSTQNWSNVVIHLDTNNSTAADRIKVWINGNAVTNTETSRPYTNMSQGQALNLFRNEELMIGHLSPSDTYSSNYNFNSYLAEFHVIDGYNKAISDFGQVDTSTNRWIAKDYKTNVGTYGNRGFYLKFDGTPGAGSGSDMGKDSSGNNIHLTEETHGSSGSAWATTDQFTDTPSKNFCTWDHGRKGGHTLSEGALKATGDAGADFDTVIGTMFVSSGKYYWEINRDSDPAGSDRFRTGVALASFPAVISSDDRTDNWAISENGQLVGGGLNLTNYGDSTTTGDYIGVALDMDRNAIYFSKNGTWMNGASASGIADGSDLPKAAHKDIYGSVTPYISTYDTQVATLRTASGRWESTAPTGFLELNQDNLDDTASKLTAWAWIKNRDASSDHMLFDRVRGVGEDLHTNNANSETTNADTVQRFLQRGVQVGSDSTVNTAGNSFVLWQWLLGDSATTGTVIPADSPPSLASTVIAADAGHFSVGTYSGASGAQTVGHGLGAAPDMLIVKGRNVADSWRVFHTDLGNGRILSLNLSNTGASSSIYWNNDGPTSTTFSVGTDASVNGAGNNYVFLAFRSIPGVCKTGLYQVNNTTDNGPYVSLGFKPRWIMFKGTDIASQWTIYDSVREPFNVGDHIFSYANLNSADQAFAQNDIDMLSDGFKIKSDINNEPNNGTGKYLYLAMAEIGGNGTLPPIYGR